MQSMIKAYRLNDFSGLGDLHMVDELVPRPQRGEIRVGVHAVSLNFRDIAMMFGTYPVAHRRGLIPASDAAGEILEIGDGVDNFKVGDRVMGTFHPRWYGGRMPAGVNRYGYGSEIDGWLAEQKVVSQESVVGIPDGMSYEEAASLPCAALTAWSALTGGAPIRTGHTVLTQGTGGVSIFAIALAKTLGATVIATTSSADKGARLRLLGADHVINYRNEPLWGEAARALTDSAGVDCVIEVGGPGTMAQSLRAVRAGGEIASIGFLDNAPIGIDFFALFGSGANFRHISVGSREGLNDVARAITVAGIQPVIDSVFDFNAARDAYAHLKSGRHFGKVMIRCAPGELGFGA